MLRDAGNCATAAQLVLEWEQGDTLLFGTSGSAAGQPVPRRSNGTRDSRLDYLVRLHAHGTAAGRCRCRVRCRAADPDPTARQTQCRDQGTENEHSRNVRVTERYGCTNNFADGLYTIHISQHDRIKFRVK